MDDVHKSNVVNCLCLQLAWENAPLNRYYLFIIFLYIILHTYDDNVYPVRYLFIKNDKGYPNRVNDPGSGFKELYGNSNTQLVLQT